MTNDEKEMWRTNIQNDATEVASLYGSEIARGIFQRYDATCFENLSPSYYWEVFGDLELMINDN